MAELTQDVVDALLPLCSERQVEKDIRDAAESRYKDLSAQIGSLMVQHDLVGPDGKGTVDLGFYKVSVFGKSKDTIDPLKLRIALVEAGVGIEVANAAIVVATNTSKWSEVRVSQAGKEDKAA